MYIHNTIIYKHKNGASTLAKEPYQMCKFWLVYTKVLPSHLLLRLLTCWQSPWQAQGTLEKFTFLEKQNKNGWMANFPFYLIFMYIINWVGEVLKDVFKTGTEHFIYLPNT